MIYISVIKYIINDSFKNTSGKFSKVLKNSGTDFYLSTLQISTFLLKMKCSSSTITG